MASLVQRSMKKGWIVPPSWVENNIILEVWTGSVAYGVSDDTSDMDIYSVVIPPKTDIFPHLMGEIAGFGPQYNRFKTWQQHHVADKEKSRSYDFTIYSLIDFLNLVCQNNPNMVDALFVRRTCVLYSNQIGELLRERRREFLHKGSWYKFRGYAMQQMHKIEHGSNSSNPKRKALKDKYGYDTKFAYHVVRLLLQAEEIMETGDLHLDRNAALLREIRNGEWTFEQLEKWKDAKDRALELTYAKSTLRNEVDMEKVKKFLLELLEIHYGSLSHAVSMAKDIKDLVYDLESVLKKYKG